MTPHRNSLGIDIGGTFTDFSLWLGDQAKVVNLKVPTTRQRPAAAVVDGITTLLQRHGIAAADIDYFVHGTTIALNTLIVRDGARLGLLVTRGFRDLLVIQRLRIPTTDDWHTDRPAPLIARRHVFEVRGRLGPSGAEEAPLSLEDIDAAVEQAREQGLDGLVICFLHAYRNGDHEVRAREHIQSRYPGLFVCCSHEVWPRMREYERALISIMNAYVAPRIDTYLEDLQLRLRELGMPHRPFITQSTGGVVSAATARQSPVETLLSGPAAGVMGAIAAAKGAGVESFVTLDMGGTSADVAFVDNGMPHISQSEHVADFPLLMPVVGVSSIGAGGGSIISVDDSGVMHVGPQSVGADPGPACYGLGGTDASVTDAFLVGGYLNPATFAGGTMTLSTEKAREVLKPIADKLGRNEAETVDAVMRVAVSTIYAELSNLAAKQGVSLRDYALVPFGGAGPLLAVPLAEELGITRVVIPANPGTLCSLGALLSDVSKTFIRSIVKPLGDARELVTRAYEELSAEALAWIEAEGLGDTEQRLVASLDMRYVGQSYEIDVTVNPEWLASGDSGAVAKAFHERHRTLFAHANEAAPVEIIDLRVTIIGETQKPVIKREDDTASGRSIARRDVVISGRFEPVPVYEREGLEGEIEGPAIIEQNDTTIYLSPGWRLRPHQSGALMLEKRT